MHLRPPEDLQRIGEVRRRVQTWQKGANLAEGCKPGRRVQTWQKGANLAEGCKPGRRVQTWQKGANLAEGCKPGRRVQKVQKVGIPLAPLHLLPAPSTAVFRIARFCYHFGGASHMAATKKDRDDSVQPICRNRKAWHEYEIFDTLECGIALTGTEVKSLRAGAGSLEEAYAKIEGGELWLIGSDIPEYAMGNLF